MQPIRPVRTKQKLDLIDTCMAMRRTEPTDGKTEMKYEATLQLSYFKPSTEAAPSSLTETLLGWRDLLQ
ncbi:uncharacterized, partial [Tachysurus ichikawai]